MARTQFKVTFTNAQPGAPVSVLMPSVDHVYSSAAAAKPVGGKQLYLDATNSITVWSDAQDVIAQTVDGAGLFIQGTATVASPTVTVGDGTAPTNPAGSAASGVLTDKGNWVTATVYAIGHVVTNSNQRYVANTAHTSSAAFTTDVAKWTSLDPGALAPLSNNNPQADGTVGPGTGTAASRDDHVHPQAAASATGSADPGLHGLAAWFGDPLYASSNFTPTAGVITFLKVRMAASTISNVILDVGGAGATVTGAFVGVYNSSGTQVGVSADISTTLQSTGIKTIPLTGAPISVTSGNAYVVAVIVTTAGTMPILRGFAGQNGMLVLGQAISSTFAPRAGTLSGQTSLPSTQAWTGLTATDNAQVTPQLALA